VRIGGCEGCWDGSVGRLEGMGDGVTHMEE
jgi:hypothetical protein